MSSIYNYFFKSQEKQQEIDDPIAKYMPEELQEQMICFVLSNATLYKLKPKNGRQEKECEFMHCSLSLGNQQIDLGSQLKNIPVIRISNDDYDEDQDQKPEEVLPVGEELLFMKYTDGADHMDEECKNEVVGFVFYYPQIALCNVIEIEIEN